MTPELPRRPRGVVFDLDGTLIDSEALVKASFAIAGRRFGIEITEEQFHSFVGKHREASNALMHAYFGADFPIDAFQAEVAAHVGDSVAPLKPGAAELLDHLAAERMPIALATSSGRPWVERHFAAHALHVRFRAIVTRADVTHGKPHPEPYLKAAAEIGVAPADALALEDSPTGLESAHAAGLMAVMIPDLLAPTPACRARAVHVADSLADVLAMLRR